MKKRIITLAILAFFTQNIFAQIQLLVNGNFSSGSTGWTPGTDWYCNSVYTNCCICSGYSHADNGSGSPKANQSGYLEQTQTLPPNTTTATLSFCLSATLNGSSVGTERIFVYIYDNTLNTTNSIATIYFPNSSGYSTYSYPVPSSCIGHSITLGFHAICTTTAVTFRVDEVSILYNVSSGCTTPGTPSTATGNATGQTTANFSWSAGSPVGSPSVTYYWVVGTSPSVTWGSGVDQSSTTGTSASTSALACNTTYYLRVYASTSCDGTSSSYQTSPSFTTSSCSATGIYGVDISAGNGTVNWHNVFLAGKTFAYVKATKGVSNGLACASGGTGYTDGQFNYNMTSSNPDGVVLGVYHFALPEDHSALDEANYFLSVAQNYIGSGFLPPALDLENPAGTCIIHSTPLTSYYNGNMIALAQWVNDWATRIHTVTNVWPVLYGDRCNVIGPLYPYFQNGTINSNIKLWIADYPGGTTLPPPPPTNSTLCSSTPWIGWPWVFHQFFAPSTAGNIPTTFANPGMDQDYFYGTNVDFNNLIGNATVCNDLFEANDDCASATPVFGSALGDGTSNYTPIGTNIGYAGDQDWFKFQLAACGTLTLTLSNQYYDYDFEIYGAGCLGQWINGSYNGSTSTESLVLTSNSSTLTTYYVKVYAHNSGNSTTATCYSLNFDWVSSAVTPSISISANPAGAICSGTSVTFTATPTNGGSSPSYQWKLNGGNAGTGSTYNNTSLSNGDVVTCELTSNANCASPTTATSNSITMTINPSVVPGISISANPTGAICSGTSVTFTSTPTNGGSSPSYQWKLNGGNVGTGSTYTTASLSNGDVVTCELTSNASCASPTTATSNSITMTINPSVVPSISISANPTGAICSGTSVTFTSTPTNGGSSPSYQWKLNGGNVGTGSTYTTTSLSNGDVVTCVLTSNASCASPTTATSNSVSLTVTTLPAPNIIFSGDTLYNTSISGSQYFYSWYLNGTYISNDSDFIICTGNGSYYLIVTENGCSDTSNTLTIVCTVGLNEIINTGNICVYPNPTNNFLNIVLKGFNNERCKIILTNTFGQILNEKEFEPKISSNEVQFDMKNLSNGIYFLSVSTNNIKQTVKVQKQ